MPPISDQTASSLPRILDALRGANDSTDEVIFRGQVDSNWDLKPTLGRKLGLSESHLLAQFRIEALRNGLLHEDDLVDELNVLALAQHHGLPTRLLDWTSSSYIALFFAFDGGGKEIMRRNSYCTVWCLNWSAFERGARRAYVLNHRAGRFGKNPSMDLEQCMSESDGIRRKFHQVIVNERVRRQRGVFTVQNSPQIGVDEYIRRRSAHFEDDTLHSITMPASVQNEVLGELRQMGVDPGHLMADLDGVCTNVVNAQSRFVDADPA